MPPVSIDNASTRISSPLCSTVEATSVLPTQSSLNKLEVIKLALKRPRGASIGVEWAPHENDLSDGDLAVLSMQLRRSKCAAIWTSKASSVNTFAKEQESSRGNFPGPVPVILHGKKTDIAVKGDEVGATAVVLEYDGQSFDVESLDDVGIIWKVNSLGQLQELIDTEKHAGGAFLLSRDMLPDSIEEDGSELKEVLSSLPKGIVTIAPLPVMLPENSEIQLGKHYASLGISSLLLEKACVGDEEDIKYSQYAIEEINKKSSSSFSRRV